VPVKAPHHHSWAGVRIAHAVRPRPSRRCCRAGGRSRDRTHPGRNRPVPTGEPISREILAARQALAEA